MFVPQGGREGQGAGDGREGRHTKVSPSKLHHDVSNSQGPLGLDVPMWHTDPRQHHFAGTGKNTPASSLE